MSWKTSARICSSVNAKPKSKLKSLSYEDAHGNVQPIRRAAVEELSSLFGPSSVASS